MSDAILAIIAILGLPTVRQESLIRDELSESDVTQGECD